MCKPVTYKGLAVKIAVEVKPNARQSRIEKSGSNQFCVWVKSKPHKGQANKEVIGMLADYFGVAKSCITLLKGQASRKKLFQIPA